MEREKSGLGLEVGEVTQPGYKRLAMKTQRGKAGPPRMTARERRRHVGIPVGAAKQKALRIAPGRKPLSVRVRGVLIEPAKGKK